MVNSGPFSTPFWRDKSVDGQKRQSLADRPPGEEIGAGRGKVQYRLRDWLHLPAAVLGDADPDSALPEACGIVPVPEDQLAGRSAGHRELQARRGRSLAALHRRELRELRVCPKCGGPAERETDTMAGSDRFVVVLPAFHRPQQPASRHGTSATRPTAGCRSIFTSADESTRSGICCTAGFSPSFCFDLGLMCATDEPAQSLAKSGNAQRTTRRFCPVPAR